MKGRNSNIRDSNATIYKEWGVFSAKVFNISIISPHRSISIRISQISKRKCSNEIFGRVRTYSHAIVIAGSYIVTCTQRRLMAKGLPLIPTCILKTEFPSHDDIFTFLKYKMHTRFTAWSQYRNVSMISISYKLAI